MNHSYDFLNILLGTGDSIPSSGIINASFGKTCCSLYDFSSVVPTQAKVNNSSLVGLGYTQTLKPGELLDITRVSIA